MTNTAITNENLKCLKLPNCPPSTAQHSKRIRATASSSQFRFQRRLTRTQAAAFKPCFELQKRNLVRGRGLDIHRQILNPVLPDHFGFADLFQARCRGLQYAPRVYCDRVPDAWLVHKAHLAFANRLRNTSLAFASFLRHLKRTYFLGSSRAMAS